MSCRDMSQRLQSFQELRKPLMWWDNLFNKADHGQCLGLWRKRVPTFSIIKWTTPSLVIAMTSAGALRRRLRVTVRESLNSRSLNASFLIIIMQLFIVVSIRGAMLHSGSSRQNPRLILMSQSKKGNKAMWLIVCKPLEVGGPKEWRSHCRH